LLLLNEPADFLRRVLLFFDSLVLARQTHQL
jgi:hypothetical protein